MEEYLLDLLKDELGLPVAWGAVPPGTDFPYVVLLRVSGRDELTNDGPTGNIDGRIQVDCFGVDNEQAILLGRQVRPLLSGYRGGPIKLMRLDAIRDRVEASGDETNQRVSLDFMTRWRV